MEEKIRIENVTKKFGSYAALDGISLSFEKGKIHGMIGRNGSGKTVLFKCICGFLRVDDGAVLVDGKQIGKEIEAPESIGAIIETPGFLPGYSARQNLQFLAGIRRKIGKKEIDEAIRKVGLDPEAKKHVGKYSLGMRQRLGIAQTIMEEPSLLILDEPMNGLDNQGVQEMRQLFLKLKEEGKTILLASHNREDIAALCDTTVEIEQEFGIPIVNKRISITPVALIGGAACKSPEDFVTIAKTLDKAAKEVGVNFIGGYSALVSKSMTKSDENLIRSVPQALACTDRICSSINVGSTKTGINMDAVRLCGEIVKETAEATKENDSLGCAKLVVFCNAPDDNPFMAGAFLGVTEGDAVINVGVSGPGVVKHAIEQVRGKGFEELCETIKKTAFKVTRVGQLVAGEASKRLGIPFGIIDLSLAPTPAVGDSVAEILEEIGLERVGAPGTTAALAMLNDQVKKGGVMASSYVGGLSGAFIPVSEDKGMIDAVEMGALTIEKLEAMTCVCSVGLDMIAIPGKTTASTISGIIADEMAIGMVNQKTTAVRLIPVIGKDVGETAEFGGLLGYAPIIPVNEYDCSAFVNRKGRIPAPVHSFKN